MKNSYKILIEKSKEKRPLGRPRLRWEDNMKLDLKYGVRVWTEFIWLRIGSIDRLV
jgi:hypothetical protein